MRVSWRPRWSAPPSSPTAAMTPAALRPQSCGGRRETSPWLSARWAGSSQPGPPLPQRQRQTLTRPMTTGAGAPRCWHGVMLQICSPP